MWHGLRNDWLWSWSGLWLGLGGDRFRNGLGNDRFRNGFGNDWFWSRDRFGSRDGLGC